MKILSDSLDHPAVQALLQEHVDDMVNNSPPGHAYVLDIKALTVPQITFFTLWDDKTDTQTLMGCGALKDLGANIGEIKSMRTHKDHLRKGVAKSLLDHIVGVARERGYEKLSLETGRGRAFEAAITLYEKSGFVSGEPFGDYLAGDFNQFYHLTV